MIRLALYQPEIPQNTGTILRMGACLGVGVDIIEPCGFALSDVRLKRAGMDYLAGSHYQRHGSFTDFMTCNEQEQRRLVLLTPHTQLSYFRFQFEINDTLLLGRESDGVPSSVRDQIEHHVIIPMIPERRSLNIAIAAGMVLGEALIQLDLFSQQREESCR